MPGIGASQERSNEGKDAEIYMEGMGNGRFFTVVSKLADLVRRPQLGYADLADFDPERPQLTYEEQEQAEIQIKYQGYIERQNASIAQAKRLEEKRLPAGMDYGTIRGLRLEAAEKLTKMQPISIGQASRISGVSPADITVLLVWLEQHKEGTDVS